MRGGMQLRLRLGLSRRVLAKVPDRVRDRAVLGDQQEQGASEVKERAAGHGATIYPRETSIVNRETRLEGLRCAGSSV
jgi:hypothetical protein